MKWTCVLQLDGKGRTRDSDGTNHSHWQPVHLDKRQFVGKSHSINVSEDLLAAIKEIRPDTSETNWILSGFEDNNPQKVLELRQKGTGDIATIVKYLSEDEVSYILYRTTDIMDDIETVKFVYVYW